MKILLLISGIFACSTAAIFIKLCTEHPLLIASYRLFVAAFILLPFFIRDYRKSKDKFTLKELKLTLLPGFILGIHFITWIIGVPMTYAANASLIVNMTVVVTPVFLYMLLREKINSSETAGTLIALIGVVILGISDFHLDIRTFKGDLLSFFSMLFFALYLVLARRYKGRMSIFLYLVPLYFSAGIFCFLISLFFINPIKAYTLNNVVMIVALGVVPTIFGHSILNYCFRIMRGQIVSILNLGQFISAGVLAFVFLGEVPVLSFYAAAIFIISGSVVAIRAGSGSTR